MMTVKKVSNLTGVSIRTLQYYDKIGLLHPNGHTEAGYRLYDDTALAALQQILLFREMEFPLKDIRQIMTQPGFDREKALTQQMELLTLQKAAPGKPDRPCPQDAADRRKNNGFYRI